MASSLLGLIFMPLLFRMAIYAIRYLSLAEIALLALAVVIDGDLQALGSIDIHKYN